MTGRTGTAETPAQTLLRGLVDDAGLFPPTALSMPQAVERHRSDRIVAHPMLTHRFLCPAGRWDELCRRLSDVGWPEGDPETDDRAAGGGGPGPGERLDVGLILPPEAGATGMLPEPDPRIRVTHCEIPADAADIRKAAHLLRSVEIGAQARTVYFEPRRGPGWLGAVEVLAGARPLGVKVRCGGVRSDLFPSIPELEAFITACRDHDVPFKATAGLHHAARHTDPKTRFTHHGYLNLLLATAVAADGGGSAEVRSALAETDERRLAREIRALDPAVAERARELFTAYGSCSTGDPVRDAGRLGLLGSWEI
ncbi:hypothetical protein HNR23_000749 [Nocardiopsis mwathae]|uniref:Uncharacterized protein n=1 Tax=Nocardiopsis mwathae TaxID=1472723 RepID=A0A7X0D523_9ACTN|nr:hypothetical protein [Nocardiopsis mwathae]MBB6170689.1 hypothetical protein [Nocardiopsis mwathae]